MARLSVSVSALMALCAKHARRVRKTLRRSPERAETSNNDSRVAPKASSVLASSKQLLASISNKAIAFTHKKRLASTQADGFGEDRKYDEEGFGDGGVWQRAILMGDKCQPPDFSGVIYYDYNGKQLSELPTRSPRATPLHVSAVPAAIKNGY